MNIRTSRADYLGLVSHSKLLFLYDECVRQGGIISKLGIGGHGLFKGSVALCFRCFQSLLSPTYPRVYPGQLDKKEHRKEHNFEQHTLPLCLNG